MTRVKRVSRDRYKGFIEKAEQYYQGMDDEYEKGRPNNSVAMAVHCAISWTDAFTVFKIGQKSSSQHHGEAISLLKDVKATDEQKKAAICKDLYRLIEMKTPAEYEDGVLSMKEAERARHLCRKIREFFRQEFDGMEF